MNKIFDNPRLRLSTLLILSAAGAIVVWAQGIALDSYNAACQPGDRFMAGEPLAGGSSATTAVLVVKYWAIALPPVLLVRRPVAVKTIFAMGILVLLAALFHFAAAHTAPYECVTMGGDYEDHSSGTFEFLLAYILLVPLSYLVAIIDLMRALYRRVAALIRR